jgi:hypothetical protein
MPAKPRAVKVPPMPTDINDLSRDGMAFLLRMCAPVITRRDIASARWHELLRASEKASAAWRQAMAVEEALLARPMPAVGFGGSAYHKAQAQRAAVRERAQRAWQASERAYALAAAFYEVHIDPRPAPTPIPAPAPADAHV